ncbi:MAG: MFS transporter [Solirubrobacterales bacterium]|nr:MFS transporter [Solirubrobacterales bacterium]
MLSSAQPDVGRGRHTTATLVAVSLVLFCVQVDFFALNLALPNLARGFGADADSAQWTISAYMLSVGSLLILAGRMGDIFGRRRALLAGVGLFAAASLACAIAPSLGFLVAARVFQGAGAAVIFPVGVAVISNAFSDASRARALGLAFGIANIGTAAGPFIGGGLAGGPGWRWVFWVLVLLCALAFLAAYFAVADSREAGAQRHLDWPGAALVIAGVTLLSVTVDRADGWGWGSARTLAGFALSVLLLVAFLIVERRVQAPLVDLKLFRNLPYVLVTGMGAVANIVYVVTVWVVTLYLQQVRGLAPLTAGAVFLAPSLMVALSGPLGGWLGKHFRPTAVMAAAGVVSGVGLFALTLAHGWGAYVAWFAFTGIGFGLGWTFASVGTQDVVSPERAGEASGVLLTILVTAGGMGVAITAAVLELLERSGSSSHEAINGTLRVLALSIVVAAAAVMAIRHRLVRRGLMAPLSMKAQWTPPEAPEAPAQSVR